jgi:hypothetical protein
MKQFSYLCLVLLLAAAQVSGQQNNKKVMTQPTLIDRFIVPQPAIDVFMQRVQYNRNFIKKLPGFIHDAAYQHRDEKGNLLFVTVAVWENETVINNAKAAVQAEYKRIGFNMPLFLEQAGITIDRGIYEEVMEKGK